MFRDGEIHSSMAMAEERGGRGEQDMKAALLCSALLCCVVSTVGLANQTLIPLLSIFFIYHFF